MEQHNTCMDLKLDRLGNIINSRNPPIEPSPAPTTIYTDNPNNNNITTLPIINNESITIESNSNINMNNNLNPKNTNIVPIIYKKTSKYSY